MQLAAGARLGPYEIATLLGRGGMGAVYKARDTRLNRIVAIKVLHEPGSDALRRFSREAQAIAALQHPHICTLRDVGHDGIDYLVGARAGKYWQSKSTATDRPFGSGRRWRSFRSTLRRCGPTKSSSTSRATDNVFCSSSHPIRRRFRRFH
jgi:serine/threonine protein kinase